MKIIFSLSEQTFQDYLNHWNELHDKNLILTERVKYLMAQSFGKLAKGELEMRLDDKYGFEVEEYFPELENVKQ